MLIQLIILSDYVFFIHLLHIMIDVKKSPYICNNWLTERYVVYAYNERLTHIL